MNQQRPASQNVSPSEPPQVVRLAGILGMVQGALGLAFAAFLVYRELNGFRDPGAVISGYGTALWFLFIFGAVLLAGLFLYQGKKWGRGPVVMLQLCLLGVVYYMFTSGRPELGIPTGIMAVVGLALMFNPVAVHWAATRYNEV